MLSICRDLPWRAPVSSLNLLITSTVWRQDHKRLHPSGSGIIDLVLNKNPNVCRIYLPPDANCLLSVADHCLKSTNYINVIVSDKQKHLQYLTIEQAIEHCTKGVSIWSWASNDQGAEPDVVMASAGDIPTKEALAAVAMLRQNFSDLKIRFINVVDLLKLTPSTGILTACRAGTSTACSPRTAIIFNFHGYPSLIHRLTTADQSRQPHVRGYKEKGNITRRSISPSRNQTDASASPST